MPFPKGVHFFFLIFGRRALKFVVAFHPALRPALPVARTRARATKSLALCAAKAAPPLAAPRRALCCEKVSLRIGDSGALANNHRTQRKRTLCAGLSFLKQQQKGIPQRDIPSRPPHPLRRNAVRRRARHTIARRDIQQHHATLHGTTQRSTAHHRVVTAPHLTIFKGLPPLKPPRHHKQTAAQRAVLRPSTTTNLDVPTYRLVGTHHHENNHTRHPNQTWPRHALSRQRLGTLLAAPRHALGSASARSRQRLGTPSATPRHALGSASARSRQRLGTPSAALRHALGSASARSWQRLGTPSAAPRRAVPASPASAASPASPALSLIHI